MTTQLSPWGNYTMLHTKSNKELYAELSKKVHGHDHAKKVLINLINRSKIRHDQRWDPAYKGAIMEPSSCLLIGNSGTGKTYLVECLQEVCDFPLYRIDATQLNPAGATGGKNLKKIIDEIKDKANELYESNPGMYLHKNWILDQMVVFVDEVDKLATSFDSSGNWNKHVQSNFLTFFENKTELDGLTFIFAGAFTGMKEELAEKKSIGFCNSVIELEEDEAVDEDIIKYGLITELVGRIGNIVKLDKLSKDHYYQILIDLVVPQKLVDLENYRLYNKQVPQDILDTIVNAAFDSAQGVRKLYKEVDKYFLDLEFDYENHFPYFFPEDFKDIEDQQEEIK